MKKNKRPPVEAYHDRVAGIYDEIYSGSLYWEFLEELTWRRIKRYIPQNFLSRILDLGCGTGEWGLKLARSGYQVTFVDISQKMIDRAENKAKQLRINAEKLKFIKADIADLSELKEEYAMAIAMGDPLSLVKDVNKALREIKRVLSPDALLIASVDHKPAGLSYYLEKGNIEDLYRFIETGESSWLTKYEEQRFPIKMFDLKEFSALLEKNGFQIIELVAIPVLPLRKYPNLLEEKSNWNRLFKIEERLSRDESYWGLSSHLEVVAKKPRVINTEIR